ncbi:MAG: type II toxin-antitoxin system HicA family toxin [Chloroflexi bacterium]|nr:type II toxin-antitoxin system HicA family toxin [Dehalococcoidia bacterium]MCO5201434.1 type II toxin-antitoxin system HicA family toxin [Chloroflexota bacterium]NJD66375.1 type II toxin-antitoxin system HicA family toxin [Chloroflexota bacterium]PWB48642.1 MAG: toxin HicA [Dehalococcoidia bacterium]
MTGREKDLQRVLDPRNDASIPFDVLVSVLQRLGFELRLRGSHHLFSREGVVEILNLQPRGATAKPYQVRQVRRVILRYRLMEPPQ